MGRWFLVAVLPLFLSARAYADVYTFADRDVHLSTTFAAQQFNLTLRDSATSAKLDYRPNVGGITIPRISYRGKWGLSWGFNTGVAESDQYFFGDTDYTDVRFDYTFHSFTINTYYSQFQGLFLENSSYVDSTITDNDPRIQRPDLYARGMGVSMTWVWDDADFSIPNLVNQSERQEANGGSFLFGGSIAEGIFRGDATLVPSNVAGDFDTLAGIKKGRFKSLQAKAGYGYAWAQKWFFGGYFLAGPGITQRKFEYDDGTTKDGWDPSARIEFLGSAGYNGDRFFTSINIDVRQDIVFLSGSSSQITSQLAYLGLTFGIHVDVFEDLGLF